MSEIGTRSGKIAPGLYRCGQLQIMKVARACWRVTTQGYGQDFKTRADAYFWCRRNQPKDAPI